MKTLYQSLLLALGALALAGAAYAQVPASNDTSDGNANTGMGTSALHGPAATNGGIANTASGYAALQNNTTGSYNTASGSNALQDNTTASYNTASGVKALFNNNGNNNTASGYSALDSNTSGDNNTASGYEALFNNNGDNNTASGYEALYSNTAGIYNTASGSNALNYNTTGIYNTASGAFALYRNTTGIYNTASGVNALQYNTTGGNNTASGYEALFNNTTGSSNIAVGFQAGANLTTGSNNIDIGSKGAAAESDTIRIGIAATHKATVIAGIYGTSVTGSAVVVSSTGRLGVTMSSERFKTAITPMGSNSAKLEQLRPVTFHLKTDPKGALQYGLIAEEVAKVYPELVIRGEKGRIDGVRYDELAPMLLNEVQKQQRINEAQAAETRDLKQQVTELKALNQATQVALRNLQSKEELVAQR
jgi:Chaperone of endosialidase